MPRIRAPLTHLILPIVCVVYMVIVKVKPAAVYKGCPVSCICSRDELVSGAWALTADCNNVQEMPELTPNITTLDLQVSESVNRVAFSSAPSLRRVHISAPNPITIHKDAFQSLSKLQTVNIKTGLPRIPSEIFCDSFHLEHLGLRDNFISTLSFDQCVLKAWTRFSSLELGKNPLRHIQANDFYHLNAHNVTELYLDWCGLEELQPGLFQYLPRLTLLDLSSNLIKVLPPGVFGNLPNLRDLFIESNDLTSLSFQDNYTFIPVLREFSFSSSSSYGVSFSRFFLSATSLSSLHLSLLDTKFLHNATFANLIRSPVTQMSLRLLSVIQISSAAFDPLQSLQVLELLGLPNNPEAMSNLFISLGRLPLKNLSIGMDGEALDYRTFEGFLSNNHLTHLDIGFNSIEKIGKNTFQFFKKVKYLYLSHNRLTIKGLEYGAFRGLDSLQSLDLSFNKLDKLPSRPNLEISATLRVLDLTGNELVVLDDRFWGAWLGLTHLYLGQNYITLVSFRPKGFEKLESLTLQSNTISSLHPDIFSGMPSLKELFINDNKIVKMNGSIFQKNDVLEHLDLRKNPLSEKTANNVFRDLSSLKVLELSGGKTPTLQDGMFNNNQMLKTLYLDDSSIISWRPEVFKPLRNLTYLSMADNKITDVLKTAFTYLTSLAYLDLSGNPLACDCKLLWFKRWISTSNVYMLDYTIIEKYTCYFPLQERNSPLIDFQLTVDDCTSHFLLKLIMGSICGFLAVCTVLSLAHRFRWYIRYYFFLARSRRRQMYDNLVDDEAFKYDVYVCYHNTSRRWVINELLPKLEHDAGIQLCLHDRNWLAGPTIMDNIIESIEQSRKTLLLVNNGFAQSGWCREETSLAYHRLIETQRNMLVVVLLEDVKQENMDRLLRSILTKRVYLKYSQSKKKSIDSGKL